MKKLLLLFVSLISLCSCNPNKVSIGSSYNLLNTYEDVYWFIDYDSACLNVQILTYSYNENSGMQYTIDKEWIISPNKYTLINHAISGYMAFSNKFYEYNDYYLLETYYRVV